MFVTFRKEKIDLNHISLSKKFNVALSSDFKINYLISAKLHFIDRYSKANNNIIAGKNVSN